MGKLFAHIVCSKNNRYLKYRLISRSMSRRKIGRYGFILIGFVFWTHQHWTQTRLYKCSFHLLGSIKIEPWFFFSVNWWRRHLPPFHFLSATISPGAWLTTACKCTLFFYHLCMLITSFLFGRWYLILNQLFVINISLYIVSNINAWYACVSPISPRYPLSHIKNSIRYDPDIRYLEPWLSFFHIC